MEEQRLRTGPGHSDFIAFMGIEIFDGGNKKHDSTRWEKIRVFKTKKGYRVGIARMTYFEEESNTYEVTTIPTADKVLEFVQGIPDIDTDKLIGTLNEHVKSIGG